MESHYFELWFANPVEQLCRNHDNGFATLLLTCSLIESYARVKTGSTATSLAEAEYVEMERILKLNDRDLLKAFWKAFRHGVSHRGTIQDATDGAGQTVTAFIVHLTARSPAIWWHAANDGREVGVDPEALASVVLDAWRSDSAAVEQFRPAVIRAPRA